MAPGERVWPSLNSVVWAKIKVFDFWPGSLVIRRIIIMVRDTLGGPRWFYPLRRGSGRRAVEANSDVSFSRTTSPSSKG